MEQIRHRSWNLFFIRVFAPATVALAVASPGWCDPPTATPSEPVTIAGYPLGRPFTMPPCPKTKYGTTDFLIKKTCWTTNRPNDEVREVWWPPMETPIGYAMWARVRDRILVGVSFATTGAQGQDRVLSQLRDKFGEPTSFSREPMQNAFGMKIEGYLAVWVGPQVYVEFRGVESQIDHGLVIMETPEEHARRFGAIQALQPPKL
jgi:hypothetical protein